MKLGTVLFSRAIYYPYTPVHVPGAALLTEREYLRRERELLWAKIRSLGHALVDALADTRRTFGRPKASAFIFPQPKRKQ